MKKNKLPVLLLAVVLFLFTACDPDAPQGKTGSAEAAITSITSADIIGNAVIDTSNNTVILTVKPMDLSSFKPVFTVSEKAVLTQPESIKDGVSAVYTVTAENGDLIEWKITVNVQYGICFTIDGTETIFTNGFSHSNDTGENTRYGNGIPGIKRNSNDSVSYVTELPYDFFNPDPTATINYIELSFSGTAAGIFNEESFRFHKSDNTEINFSINFNVTEYGILGKNFKATFNGENLTNGFAKLKVVEQMPG